MLKGPRITLRAITRDDLPRYVIWLNDLEVVKHLTTYTPFNLDDETDWYEDQRKNSSQVNFAVDTETGKHIGSIGLIKINGKNQSAELGIVIGDKDEWGKGYCAEAINLLLEYAFNTLNLNRIFLRVNTDNLAGIKCYRRCGFITEGEMRQVVFKGGQFMNNYIMSVLRSEYQSR